MSCNEAGLLLLLGGIAIGWAGAVRGRASTGDLPLVSSS